MSRQSFEGSRSYESDSEKKRYSSSRAGYFGEQKGELRQTPKEDKVRQESRNRRSPKVENKEKFGQHDGQVNQSFRSLSLHRSARKGSESAEKYRQKNPEYSPQHRSYSSGRRDSYERSISSGSGYKDRQSSRGREDWRNKDPERKRSSDQNIIGEKRKYKSEIRRLNDNYADDFGYNHQDQFIRDPGRGNKLLGMSSRQQVKYLMQKTQKEAGWDMDNDSDLKGGSESSENENDMIKKYYSHVGMWRSTFQQRPNVNSLYLSASDQDKILPNIKGFGGCWGLGVRQKFNDGQVDEDGVLKLYSPSDNAKVSAAKITPQDSVEPFFIQYEKRMECLRNTLVQDQKYRLRMYALSTLQYNPIKQNKYIERKKNIFTDRDARTFTCNCQKSNKLSKMVEVDQKSKIRKWGRNQEIEYKSLNCGKRCINRDMSFECSVLSCPAQNYCTNRHFQLFQDRLVYPIRTQYKGWGLAAGEFIPQDSFIMQYVGEIFNVDSDIGIKRIQKYKKSTCTYLMRIDNNEVIDPTVSGNVARFINHSCDPNCQTRKWTVMNEVCVGIFALKDLQENEELTFDYQFDFFKTPFTRCYCGTKKCKGFLGVATNISSTSESMSSEGSGSGESDQDDEDQQLSFASESSLQSQLSGIEEESEEKESQVIQIIFDEEEDEAKKQKKIDKEQKRLQTDDQPNQERPMCSQCSKEIQDSKQLVICKGPCKRIFHYMCAVKQDKTLKNDPSILKKRKFECRPCNRKASGQKKRGRKSNKEIMEMMMNKQMVEENQNEIKEVNEENENNQEQHEQKKVVLKQPRIEDDLEVQKIMENSPKNLLLDRMIALQIRKVEKQMQKSAEREYNRALAKDRQPSRHKKFPIQQFSDHYVFMFELIRRLKAKTKQIVDITQADGPGGCEIVLSKFFKEFPRIARTMQDVESIVLEGLSNEFLFNKQERNEDNEERNQGRLHRSSSQPARIKRKYVRRKGVANADAFNSATNQEIKIGKVQRRRGRPPKSLQPIGVEIEEQAEQEESAGDEIENVKYQQSHESGVDSASSGQKGKIIGESQNDESQEPQDQEEVEDDQAPSNSDSIMNDDEEDQESQQQESAQDYSSENNSLYSQCSRNEGDRHNDDHNMFNSNSIEESRDSRSIDSDSEGQSEKGEEEIDEPVQEVSEQFERDATDEEGEENDSDEEMDGSNQSSSESNSSNSMIEDEQKAKPAVLQALKVIQGEQEQHFKRGRGRPPKNRGNQKAKQTPYQETSNKDQLKAQLKRRKRSLEYDRKIRKNSTFSIREEAKAQISKKEEALLQQLNKEYKQLKDEIEQRWDSFVTNEIKQRQESGITRIETKPTRFNVNERVFNLAIKNHIQYIECVDGLHVFWDKPWGSNVTLKIVSSKYQFQYISTLIQYCTNRVFQIHSQSRVLNSLPQFEIQKLQVPKNFIRKLVGYQEKSLSSFRMNPKYNVDFYFDEKLLVDDIFRMDEYTQLRIFGRKKDVSKVSEILLNKLESIMMKSILIQQIDCNYVMTNVKEIKSLVDPCEVRIKQNERVWKDLRHPFLYLPNYLRDIILIGTNEEIQIAEKKLSTFLRQKREREDDSYTVNQQLSFVLPIFIKENIERYKKDVYRKFGKTIQVFHYTPAYPRKHLTVSLIGPWNALLDAKEFLYEVSKGQVQRQYGNYESFERTVFHQQIRFAFKSLKRYILEKDIKYLSHWDIVSVFVDNIGKDFKFEFDENDIQMLIKEKQQSMVATDDQEISINQSSFVQSVPPPQQESFLDQLMNDDPNTSSKIIDNTEIDQNDSLLKPDNKKLIQLSMKKQDSYISNQNQEQQPSIKREDIIREYQEQMDNMRSNEVKELIRYIKQEDPETCINILFVLSQCQSDEKDELNLLMERLKIKKSFLVECMHTVLYDNLLDFFQSIGKQKHHIHQFESDSSSNFSRNDVQMDQESDNSKNSRQQRTLRDHSNSRRDSKGRRNDNRSRSRSRYFKGKDFDHHKKSPIHNQRQKLSQQSRNSSRDQIDQKRYQRRYDRPDDRIEEPKVDKDFTKVDKYEARYYEKFGKYRSPRDQQPPPTKLKMKESEGFVIQNDQQIPRYGFSRTINRNQHIPQEAHGEENESRFQDNEHSEQERISFLNKRQRVDTESVTNQTNVQEENQENEIQPSQETLRNQLRSPTDICEEMPPQQESETQVDDFTPAQNINDQNLELRINFQQDNQQLLSNLRRTPMQIQGQGDMVGNRNSSNEGAQHQQAREISSIHQNTSNRGGIDFPQSQRFQHHLEEDLMYSQYEQRNRIIPQPYEQEEYQRENYIEENRNFQQMHSFNDYSRLDRPQMRRVGTSIGQPRRADRQVSAQFRQRQNYHPQNNFFHQASENQHINVASPDDWEFDQRLNQEEDRQIQMQRIRRPPQYHDSQPEIFDFENSHNPRIPPPNLQQRDQSGLQFQREDINYNDQQIFEDQIYENRNRSSISYPINYTNQSNQNYYPERSYNRSTLIRYQNDQEPEEFREPSGENNSRGIAQRQYGQYTYSDRGNVEAQNRDMRSQYQHPHRSSRERVSRIPHHQHRRRDFQGPDNNLHHHSRHHHSKRYD